MVRRITLSNSDERAVVDDVDYEALSGNAWTVSRGYARRTHWVDQPKGICRTVFMHREIMEAQLGCKPKAQVDHRNGNKLDNRRANLRLASHADNQQNKKKNPLYGGKQTSSVYKGVSFKPLEQSWYTYVSAGGECQSFGAFKDEVEAARVYDAVAMKLHADFANLNFPDEIEESQAVYERYLSSRRPYVKLEQWQRYAILRAFEEAGFTKAHLARQFGVSECQVYNIVRKGR